MTLKSRVGSKRLLGFIYVSTSLLIFTWPLAQAAEPPKASSDTVLAEKVIRSLPEDEIKRLEKDSAEGASSDELRETEKALLAHFKTARPVKISGLEAHLLKVTQEMSLSPPHRDRNYNYELIYSGSATRHLVLLTIRSYQNGSVDYALASRPENRSADQNGDLKEKSAQTQNQKANWWSETKPYLVRDGFLLLAFCVPLFMFAVAYVCFRARPPWRLFWLLFIFVGVCRINMDWSTGAVSVFPLQIIYLGFQIKQSFIEGLGPGPWIVSASFPVGAVAYIIFSQYV